MLSWEKPPVKSMAPGSTLHHISFRSIILVYYLFCNLYFPIYTTKIPKIFILLSLSDLTFASGREGIDNPLSRWLQGSWLFMQVLGDLRVVSYGIDTLVLKNWGKYLRYFAASPFPLQGKTNACSRASKKDFWRCCQEAYAKSSQDLISQQLAISGAVAGEIYAQVKTYQVPITNSYPSHYIICHLPLIFLSPQFTLVILFALSLYPPYLFASSVRLLFVCSCASLIACRHG